MNEVLILLLTNIFSPIITGYVTYRLTKKKYSAEVDGNLILNMKDSLLFYLSIVEDNQQKLEDLLAKNNELENKVDDLKKEVNLLYLFSCLKEDCDTRIPSTCMLKHHLNERYKDYGKDNID